ncbi:MAG TPA: pyrimidine dimer DNA glycosylase/endonuclease V [Pedococcus sp.]|jgi:hypothetical protein
MRLWSLHPRYLDRQGLTACWREALLAQAVLAGRTRGYRQHPQLTRFREAPSPLDAIGAYLTAVADEAHARGYRYDPRRIDRIPAGSPPEALRLPVTTGQLDHEWGHLVAKLAARSPEWLAGLGRGDVAPGRHEAHPLFTVVEGPVADWEVV